ncbi:MAG: Gfo/Idh/MocA family oxidoreductase [Bacteroidota bacterium]|nr:Gfo/Idh/MocA family oxidoreductase [Bacteroidota bacterium]
MIKVYLLSCCFLFTGNIIMAQGDTVVKKPLRVGIIGLVHTHVHWILGREKMGDIEIVGIAEPNRKLAESYSQQHGYSINIVFNSMEEMIEKTKPEVVLAFNTIYDHLKTVEYCAPRGIHVMVEKPLAVNMEHAKKMLDLAKKNNIYLLTNYETSWYGSNRDAWQIINERNEIGGIRKIVFHTGHQGPIEIGCNPEFLEWLTDPVLNGGGALTDFGCYGANLCTWFMKGEHPLTVTAITQQMKPEEYPKVEDEATIVLTYSKAQVIIQASWNWPFNRKDMEVYGQDGYVFCLDRQNMLLMTKGRLQKDTVKASPMPDGSRDPFMYFANVVRGKIKMDKYDLSAPANNEIVMEILEAAKHSAKTGKTVIWKDFFKN